MARKVEVKNWLEQGDHKQLNWVKDYLIEHNKFSPAFVPADYHDLLSRLNDILSSELGKVFISKMKAKWRQEKYTNNKKPSSFVISKSAHNRLENLCREVKEPKNKVVEHLITSEYEKIRREKELEKENKKRRKRREDTASYGLSIQTFFKKDDYVLELESQLMELRAKLETFKDIANNQLKLICHHEVIIEENKLDLSGLTDEQLEMAEQKYLKRVNSRKAE